MGQSNKRSTDPFALLKALAIPERGDWRLTLDRCPRTTLWTLFMTYSNDQSEAVGHARDLSLKEMCAFLEGLRFGQNYDWSHRG